MQLGPQEALLGRHLSVQQPSNALSILLHAIISINLSDSLACPVISLNDLSLHDSDCGFLNQPTPQDRLPNPELPNELL